MLFGMLERGEPIEAVVYLDAGEWEFPQMAAHIAKVEARIAPIPLVRLHPRKPFTWYMLHKEVRPRGGGDVRFVGWGWPSPLRRWCTREKTGQIDKFSRSIGTDVVQAIGFAADEARRTDSANMKCVVTITVTPRSTMAVNDELGELRRFLDNILAYLPIGGRLAIITFHSLEDRMAPLHHHFELKGVPESKIIIRFWITSILLGLVALSVLKLR